MTLDEAWDIYTRAWTNIAADARAPLLARIITDDCVLRMPAMERHGRDAFAAQMAQFQRDSPGACFRTRRLLTHHGHALAEWDLIGPDGTVRSTGCTHVRLAPDGRFVEVTGFWETPPPRPAPVGGQIPL